MLDDVIHAGAEATVAWLTSKDPGLKPLLDKAHAYAVFPEIGRASAVLGGAHGYGEVFEHGKPIGFASLTQMTVGVQVGGQTFSELVLFNNKDALEALKKGKISFTANASAVIVKAAATGTSDFQSVVAHAYSRGGMLLEASIGGQKLTFRKHLDESKKKKERPEETTKASAAPQEAGQEARQEAGQDRGQDTGGEARSSEGAGEQTSAGAQPEDTGSEAKQPEDTAQASAAPQGAGEEAQGPQEQGPQGTEQGYEGAQPDETAQTSAAPPREDQGAGYAGEQAPSSEGAEQGADGAAEEPQEARAEAGGAADARPDTQLNGVTENEERQAPPQEAAQGTSPLEGASKVLGAATRNVEPVTENVGQVAGNVGEKAEGVKERVEEGAGLDGGRKPTKLLERLAGTGRKVVGKVAHFVAGHAGPKGLKRVGLSLVGKQHPTLVGKPVHLLDKIKGAATGLEKEAAMAPALSREVDAAVRRMIQHDPGLSEMIDKAYGFAVFPQVGKAGVALGVGFGRGEVFERGKLIGYAGIVQLTLGVQVGGQTYDELILFENQGALDRFKSGDLAFASNASAVIVKAGAAATTNYSSATAVFVHPAGGLMIELGLGGQKFIFRKKVLGGGPAPRTSDKSAQGGAR